MAKQPKPREVQLLEFSLAARLRNLLAERKRLEALCKKHGVAYRDPFVTAAELDVVEADHEAHVRGIIVEHFDPNSATNRIARLALSALNDPKSAAARDWHATQAAAERIVDEQERQRLTANLIVRAGNRRRAEKE